MFKNRNATLYRMDEVFVFSSGSNRMSTARRRQAVIFHGATAVYKVTRKSGRIRVEGKKEHGLKECSSCSLDHPAGLLLASRFTCKSAIMPEPDDGKATLDSGQLASGRVSGRETPQGSISLRHPRSTSYRCPCSTTFG